MENSGKRLRDLLDDRSIAYSAFSSALGIDPQRLNNWFKRGIPKEFLFQAADELHVNARWLHDGTPPSQDEAEEIYKDHPRKDNVAVMRHNEGKSPGIILEPLHPWDDSTPLDEDEVELPLYKEVELAAGDGRTAVQEVPGRKLRFSYATLRAAGVDPSAAVCATLTGTSMSPLIIPGATIGIDRSSTNIIDSEIYALDHDGMLRVKFVYRLPGGGIRLRSYNSEEHPDEEYTREEIQQRSIKVLGWVFWWSTVRRKGQLSLVR
ncbi:S24 family peptidase [Pseudomonas citronellolis]|uniref:S24 family peptidase n=1 Tax=Pseudomonas citronellolis TaxID=53408 RepID=A0AAW6P7C7_9PSED|nr:S24 family peptidase [Pseudomonas citronellolis]MDF3842689.1 S24 family peptidase [Pseudomonas citronellolis]